MTAETDTRGPLEVLLGLLAPAALGDEVTAGLRLVRASTEFGMRLVLQETAGGGEVTVEVAAFDEGRPYAAASRHFAFSYRVDGALDEGRGFALCEALAERALNNEDRVLGALAGVRAGTAAAPRIRPVEVSSLLELLGNGDDRFLGLSPYVGCLIGCRFCYAQSHLAAWRKLVGLPDAPWGSYVEVRRNAPEVLRRELETAPPLPIKFCPVASDPYHAIEEQERLTRACLEVLREDREKRPPRDVLVLTRGALVRRDFDLLGDLGAYLGVSLPTIDDEVRAHFEPRGATVTERLALLRDARFAGAQTFAVVQPILPGNIDALADALAETVSSVRVAVLEGEEGAAADFRDPRYAPAREAAWQADRAQELGEALGARGVALWTSELPPSS